MDILDMPLRKIFKKIKIQKIENEKGYQITIEIKMNHNSNSKKYEGYAKSYDWDDGETRLILCLPVDEQTFKDSKINKKEEE